jgi:hypothetical protein
MRPLTIEEKEALNWKPRKPNLSRKMQKVSLRGIDDIDTRKSIVS